MTSVIFLIKKNVISDEDLITVKKVFKEEYEEDLVYIFTSECIKDSYYVRYIHDKILPNLNTDDFVFMKIGEDISDYEILGDCYCNFKKYLRKLDIKLVREFQIKENTTLQRKIEAVEYLLTFFNSIEEFLENKKDFVFEGTYEEYLIDHIVKSHEDVLTFNFKGKPYLIHRQPGD